MAGRWQKVQQLGRLGVRRRVWAMCSCEAACVWAWRGRCREGEERVPHACRCGRGSRLAPGHERGATHCVCVCATQPGALCGVCSSRGRAGCGGGREGSPHATLRRRQWTAASSCVCVRPPGWRRARALEPKRDARRSATASLADGGSTSGRKIKQLVFQSREAGRGAGGMRLDRGPSPS